MAFRTLSAIAEALVVTDGGRAVPPEDVARNADAYLASFTARRKWLVTAALLGLQFYPLVTLRPPLTRLDPDERLRFARQRFYTDVARRRIPGMSRWALQSMIRVAQQMVYLGYYGDPRSWPSVGYVPFSQRARSAQALSTVELNRPRVTALGPGDVDARKIHSDVVVVGTGAAGAILAFQLAASGREVLLVERGEHVDPSEFTEHEPEMLARLYGDGALQLSRDFRFQIVQGSCVGGSTVVNNGVCFDPPQRTLDRWNDPRGLDAGLDLGALTTSLREVRDWFSVRRQTGVQLQAGGAKFVEGVHKLGLDVNGRFGIVEANLAGCLGTGYCNIGCAYGKKLSMLDTILPEGQRRFGDRMRVLAECEVERIITTGRRATGLQCRLSDGRQLRISASTVVVAAGAIKSSLLLLRSDLGGPLVGRNLAFNISSGITADYDEELHSYDGLQLTHYLVPPDEPGYVVETFFNPVMTQALAMPGWFEDHYNNMRRYIHLTQTGVIAPSGPYARVKPSLLRTSDVIFRPTPEDLKRLLDGVKLAGRIHLAAGARRVMPATFHYHQFHSDLELDRLDNYVRDASDINLVTGHPQGGNALSRDPRKGVVDESFRVHGVDNVYVCDASVFPTSVGVNPQLTVMALAHYAAPRIALD